MSSLLLPITVLAHDAPKVTYRSGLNFNEGGVGDKSRRNPDQEQVSEDCRMPKSHYPKVVVYFLEPPPSKQEKNVPGFEQHA